MRLLYRSWTHDLKGHAMKETSIRRASWARECQASPYPSLSSISTLSGNARRRHDHRPCRTSHQSIYRSTHMCHYENIHHTNRKRKIRLLSEIYDLWCESPNQKRKNIRRAPYAWVFETLPSAFLRIPQQQMNVIRTKYSRKAKVGIMFIHSSRQTMQTKQSSNRDHMAKILMTVSW